MKIALVGAWQYEMYEASFATALKRLGVEVEPIESPLFTRSLMQSVEYKYGLRGLYSRRDHANIISRLKHARADVTLIWLGAHVFPQTIAEIRNKSGGMVVGYVHDDPFAHRFHNLSPTHHRLYWRPLMNAMPDYDLMLFAKKRSAEDAKIWGAREVGVLPQYFVPWLHRPVRLEKNEQECLKCDVAFAGHYESDGRDEALCSLARAGFVVGLYQGGGWHRSNKFRVMKNCPNFRLRSAVRGDDYAKAIVAAGLCLGFMSKMNRDSYTTRCFEIPACGSVLVSERTEDLRQMFKEDVEAVFFSSTDELVEKVTWLKCHPDESARIAAAGLHRVHRDGHSVDHRAKQFLEMVERQKRTQDF